MARVILWSERPVIYLGTPVVCPTYVSCLPAIKLFSHNPVDTSDWRLVNPDYDPQSGIYYARPVVEPLEGTKHLDTLLSEFCFRSP